MRILKIWAKCVGGFSVVHFTEYKMKITWLWDLSLGLWGAAEDGTLSF